MINQEPDFGGLMPDTFVDLENGSYGGSVDDYQSRVDDFDLKGPNAQYLPSAGFEGEGGEPGDDCCDELAVASEKIECLEDLILPDDLNGEFSWYHQASSTRPDYGPPPINPYPACTKIISSQFSVKWVENSDFEFARFNVNPPITECAATGSIGISIDTELRNPPVGINIGWSFAAGYSTVTEALVLDKTYYVWAAGANLNENSYSEPWKYLGSFTVTSVPPENPGDDPTVAITRSIEVVNTFTEGEELPCGIEPPIPEPVPES